MKEANQTVKQTLNSNACLDVHKIVNFNHKLMEEAVFLHDFPHDALYKNFNFDRSRDSQEIIHSYVTSDLEILHVNHNDHNLNTCDGRNHKYHNDISFNLRLGGF